MAGLFGEAGRGAESVPGEEGMQVVILVGHSMYEWFESGAREDLRQ